MTTPPHQSGALAPAVATLTEQRIELFEVGTVWFLFSPRILHKDQFHRGLHPPTHGEWITCFEGNGVQLHGR